LTLLDVRAMFFRQLSWFVYTHVHKNIATVAADRTFLANNILIPSVIFENHKKYSIKLWIVFDRNQEVRQKYCLRMKAD